MAKQNAETWSPYGHERARRALLNQRRAQILLAAIAIAVLYAVFLSLTLQVESAPRDRGVEVETPEQKPITITVRPGQMAEYVDASHGPPEAASAPRVERQPQNELIEKVTPFLSVLMPLAAAFWLLGRIGTSARGKLAEVNLGVFKGAMPYELHTARAFKSVFTYRQVDTNVFGKEREDYLFGSYLHEPPMSVRRLLGEEIEDARIAALKRGGTPKERVVPTPSRNTMTATVQASKALIGDLARRLPRQDPRAARLRELRKKARQTEAGR